MKCRFCKKEIDISKSIVVDGIYADWYGRYVNNELVEITCLNCIRENREEWKRGSEKKGK